METAQERIEYATCRATKVKIWKVLSQKIFKIIRANQLIPVTFQVRLELSLLSFYINLQIIIYKFIDYSISLLFS